MLDALRRGAQGWVAKVLFALLILSFGVFWNVSDFIGSITRAPLAKVGSTAITADRFQHAFQNRLATLSENSGQRITTEMAVRFGLHHQVMDGLIGQAALLTQADALNLGLSQQALVERLKSQKEFLGADGKFSRSAFDSFLRQTGLSEQAFMKLYREDELRRQISDALAAATAVPQAMIDERHAYQAETRTLSHFDIKRDKLPKVAEPDEATLKAYFDGKSYMTPETRKLAVIVLALDDLMKEVPVSDDEIKEAYEATKATYDKPERRRLQQIAFKDKDAAAAAREQIVSGKKTFVDAAKDAGAKESDINLGWLSESQMIDPVIAKAAFALARDAVSDPVEGKFATVLVRAIEIEPGKMSTLEDAKDKVRESISRKKATALLQERADLVEEDRNAGKTFADTATSQKLKLFEVEATADNKTADGKTAIDHPDAAAILSAAFSAEQGSEHEPVTLASDGYAWYDVQTVTAPRKKEFEAVKDEVKSDWTEAEVQKQIADVAKTLVDRLNAGEAIETVAAEAGDKVQKKDTLTRNTVPPDLTEQAMRIAFGLAKGKAASAPTANGQSRSIFRVDDIVAAPAPTDEERKALTTSLKAELENDAINTYVGALKSRLGTQVDEAQLKRLTGTSDE